MEHLSPNHPYFSTDNTVTLVGLIDARVVVETGDPFELAVDQQLISAMIKAATDRPEWLMTANPQEGINRLNDLVVRRVVRNLTADASAGTYGTSYIADQRQRPRVYNGNGLYKATRGGDDALVDPKQTHAGYIFGANIFKKHNEKYQAEMLKAREQYANHPQDARFDMIIPAYLKKEK
jgi:hypothetical protein